MTGSQINSIAGSEETNSFWRLLIPLNAPELMDVMRFPANILCGNNDISPTSKVQLMMTMMMKMRQ